MKGGPFRLDVQLGEVGEEVSTRRTLGGVAVDAKHLVRLEPSTEEGADAVLVQTRRLGRQAGTLTRPANDARREATKTLKSEAYHRDFDGFGPSGVENACYAERQC
jgi:hypothetical protein